MGSANRRTILSEQIADILGTRDTTVATGDRTDSALTIRKSIACGSMMLLALNPGHVGAVGLGDLHLKSRLGQPLEAVVPVTLREGESLPKNCVKPAPSQQSLGAPPNLQVTAPARNGPGVYNVRVSTVNPLHEPMYELSLMVKCQGVPLLVRQYVLMLDLPGMPVTATASDPVVSPVSSSPVARRGSNARSTAPTARRAPVDSARTLPPRFDSIAAGSRYRVSSGDSLSTIARRVAGRLPDTTWAVADQIFADNPNAFIRNDPNLIKLGSLIRVPEATALAAMAPGARRGFTPVTATAPAETPAAAPRAQTRTTTRTPVTVSRSEPVTTRRATEAPAEPATTRWPNPGSAEANAALEAAETAAAASASVADNGGDASDYSSSFNPFADGQPAETVVSAPDAMEEIAPTPAVTTTAATVDSGDEAGQSSSLLSVLIALLIGAGLSLVFLRSRLMEALGAGRRRKPVVARATQSSAVSGQTDTFNESVAAAAFDRTSGNAAQTPALPISGPAEDTYIVETAIAEPTVQEDVEGLRAGLQESDTATQPPAVDAGDTLDKDDDSAELAKLFDEPTAEMPRQPVDTLEPTAEMPRQADGGFYEPTMEVPQHDEGEVFDPTAELPEGALDDIFDPTGGLDEGGPGEIESTLMQAFNEDLENLDPDEMFATAGHSVNELTGDPAVDALDATINDPLDNPLLDDPTVSTELHDLPLGDDEDEGLSETLQEALNLLERDYEDEFTASQILERSTLEKSLKEDLEQMEAEQDKDTDKRKIS